MKGIIFSAKTKRILCVVTVVVVMTLAMSTVAFAASGSSELPSPGLIDRFFDKLIDAVEHLMKTGDASRLSNFGNGFVNSSSSVNVDSIPIIGSITKGFSRLVESVFKNCEQIFLGYLR